MLKLNGWLENEVSQLMHCADAGAGANSAMAVSAISSGANPRGIRLITHLAFRTAAGRAGHRCGSSRIDGSSRRGEVRGRPGLQRPLLLHKLTVSGHTVYP